MNNEIIIYKKLIKLQNAERDVSIELNNIEELYKSWHCRYLKRLLRPKRESCMTTKYIDDYRRERPGRRSNITKLRCSPGFNAHRDRKWDADIASICQVFYHTLFSATHLHVSMFGAYRPQWKKNSVPKCANIVPKWIKTVPNHTHCRHLALLWRSIAQYGHSLA